MITAQKTFFHSYHFPPCATLSKLGQRNPDHRLGWTVRHKTCTGVKGTPACALLFMNAMRSKRTRRNDHCIILDCFTLYGYISAGPTDHIIPMVGVSCGNFPYLSSAMSTPSCLENYLLINICTRI